MKEGLVIDGLGIMLTRQSQEDVLLSSRLGSEMVPTVTNGEYHSFRIPKPQRIGGKLFGLNLMFKNGLLERVNLVPTDGVSGWDEVTDESLRRANQANEQWLEEHFTADMTWGKVEAELDKKTGLAQIVITMK